MVIRLPDNVGSKLDAETPSDIGIGIDKVSA